MLSFYGILLAAVLGSIVNLLKTLFEYARVSRYKKCKLDTSRLKSVQDEENSIVNGKNFIVNFELDDDEKNRKGSLFHPVPEDELDAWIYKGVELEVYLWEKDGEIYAVPTNYYPKIIKLMLKIICVGAFVFFLIYGYQWM